MSIRLIDSRWDDELLNAVAPDDKLVRIVCPFIKHKPIERLLSKVSPRKLQVLTRFNLDDVVAGVTDLSALRLLLDHGAQIRGVRNLHAKLYVFGNSRAIVTSANLTDTALRNNHEFGLVSEEASIVAGCRDYADAIWGRAGYDLTKKRLASFQDKVNSFLARGAPSHQPSGLGDEGTDVGAAADPPTLNPWFESVPRSFVKFLGKSADRVLSDYKTIEEVDSAGCHWALAYPRGKRPRTVRDGDQMFIGRMMSDPNDYRIFGRAIGMRHIEGRDDATEADIALRYWRTEWSHYIRVHHAEFLDGTMGDGVSLNELMDTLKERAFASTSRNANAGEGNITPRKALMQQARVELSPEGAAWLTERLDRAFTLHGRIAQTRLAQLDWPEVPTSW